MRAHCSHEQGVTIGRCAGHDFGADIAAGAALVFNHERLAKRFGQFRRYGAGQDIGSAAGCKGNHNFYRLVGPGPLGPGRKGRGGGQQQR